jgi:hypothetical protein
VFYNKFYLYSQQTFFLNNSASLELNHFVFQTFKSLEYFSIAYFHGEILQVIKLIPLLLMNNSAQVATNFISDASLQLPDVEIMAARKPATVDTSGKLDFVAKVVNEGLKTVIKNQT